MPPTNPTCFLPPEIACVILSSLPDFTTLFSAIQSSRFFHDTFTTDNNGLFILRSIFQRKCFSLETGKYGSVLRDLFDIMRYVIVPRDWARGVFEECWGFFMERGIEEMLIPIGMALAWSLPGQGQGENRKQQEQEQEQEQGRGRGRGRGRVLAKSKKHLDEAIDLLEDIWKGSAPFGWTKPSDSLADFPLRDEKASVPAWPSVYPLGVSLVKLYGLLPQARDNSDNGNENQDHDNLQINGNNVRSLARDNILKMLRPHYDNLDVAVVAGIDIYIDTRTYQDEYGDLARNGVQFLNKPTQLLHGGFGGGGRLRYSARPVGDLLMFWMRIGSRPRFLPRDRLSGR
ncbi:hypothetical protein AJ78_03954 [Emergomyces pasteurianus Ep9510]|uniref:F-box domain-containing protein n=1 Tax=Emergomyces pasteurianus Ep9510 TaxID=1447872 RepID=A0A1J9QIU2_9EURO|nr:hypothetical protein AJ78_03954 [Emergomyces pasteurianus Ep9510]